MGHAKDGAGMGYQHSQPSPNPPTGAKLEAFLRPSNPPSPPICNSIQMEMVLPSGPPAQRGTQNFRNGGYVQNTPARVEDNRQKARANYATG